GHRSSGSVPARDAEFSRCRHGPTVARSRQERGGAVELKTALLIIAHGSRQDEANAALAFVVDAMRRRNRYAVVEAAFLELPDPDIDGGVAKCVAAGAARVVLLPYFLSAGVHVQRDLTDARRRLAAQNPEVEFRLAEPLGRHPLLLDVVAQRADE